MDLNQRVRELRSALPPEEPGCHCAGHSVDRWRFERCLGVVMLRSLIDLAPGQTEPHLPLRNADPLDRGGGNDVVSLVEVMPEPDDEIALTGCIARPGDLAASPSVAST